MSTRGTRPPAIEPAARDASPAGASADAAVMTAVRGTLRGDVRVVLAVSGGRDSMVLLHAAARVRRAGVTVATFDHGTGPAAARAAALVERRSAELGFPVARGHAQMPSANEAAWREARWRFLRDVAAREGALVATAHTRDDQLETVLMRALRGAGARGLAALYAPGAVLRPLLEVSRSAVATYARHHALSWVEDPSNQSRRFLRNRIRMDLLPALARVDAALPDTLLRLARDAAVLRRAVDAVVDGELAVHAHGGVLQVARADLLRYDAQGLRLLCPAMLARVGITLDRRGTRRLAEFIIRGKRGGRIQLAGGYEASVHREMLLVRRHAPASGVLRGSASLSTDPLEIDGWRFVRIQGVAEAEDDGEAGPWVAVLPADHALAVRPWRPGDRMMPLGAVAPRRVKGLLRDAGIGGPSRTGWPVVLAGDQIVWIPGVRRSRAATARPGRPEFVYRCERIDC